MHRHFYHSTFCKLLNIQTDMIIMYYTPQQRDCTRKHLINNSHPQLSYIYMIQEEINLTGGHVFICGVCEDSYICAWEVSVFNTKFISTSQGPLGNGY